MERDQQLRTGVLIGLERMLNTVLRLDPEHPQRLSVLAGKVILIEVRGLNLSVFVSADRGLLGLNRNCDVIPDATISAPPVTLMRAATGRNRDGTDNDLHIEGDIELAREFANIIGGLDIDWEEQFSKISGDLVAHQTGNLLRDLRDFTRDSADALQRDLGDYLKEELRILPTRPEIEIFLEDVDIIRDRMERLEARVRRLEHGSRGSTGGKS